MDNGERAARGWDPTLRPPQTSCSAVRNLDWKRTKLTKKGKRGEIRKHKEGFAQVEAGEDKRERGLLQPSASPAQSTSSTGHWSLTGP